ncbi:E3 ubiquitin-protein ligase HECTD3 isoform X2 [Neophocaena asiaeorientalis asiaeorientalis]|uniref:E3 ubiquitin-protein ligase HECTD3 isoform X2 n=1 Tax=Neophocaena asiaeorientalis asiaeorientalis TaxID=1706337 RepID=A0A341CWE9_NEOAA|nr:E3 ubiquitin-protein ligase HECTD3 isoform X2 [Neophocaena asiaeorientalis asiaeorientalis]
MGSLVSLPGRSSCAGSSLGFPGPPSYGGPGPGRGARVSAPAAGPRALPGGGSEEPPRWTAVTGGASFRAARGALQALQGPGGTVARAVASVGGGGPGAACGSHGPGHLYRLRAPPRRPRQHRAPARRLRAHHGRGAVQRPRALGEADQGAAGGTPGRLRAGRRLAAGVPPGRRRGPARTHRHSRPPPTAAAALWSGLPPGAQMGTGGGPDILASPGIKASAGRGIHRSCTKATEEFNVSCLTDSNADTYWESDGSQCQHWVRLTMKKGTIVKKLLLTVDTTDDNFMPKRVVIYGGEGDNLKKLSDVSIDETLIGDVCVLEDMTVHLPVIEIRIVECRDDGIDVRLRGVKIKSSRQRELGLNADLFQPTSLVRYPRLEGTDPEVLYRRAVLLQRFIKILDSVLHHLVPAWDHTLGTFSEIKQVKQFLLLSRQRPGLVAQCLRDSESSKPSFMPRLYINRRLAMEHRACPLRDPACKNAVFTQVYEGLKPSDKYEKPLDYRWPMRYDQWWECKFIAEGIIDQGGGFRDSLADMSEELCPSSADTPVPLPFFVRTANQGNGTGEARDMYVPNPSCRDFAKYEWIGQLMGAALRGKEFLVLALPGFVWKQLSGEEVSWSKDFPAVDSVLVKLLEVMEGMDKETFEFKFGKELTFTTVLSDQQVVELIPGGAGIVVGFEDRSRFIQLVQKARLEESKEQVSAMQAGLLKVVPQAVLDLLTWQELEKKVCGDPEVTVDALRKLTRFEDFEPSDTRVQYFWEALNNFTNEDRSRFLRFVTGRSRLPARIYIYPDKLGYETTDALPESSTCSSTLFLPHYASAKVCEEKLRYAAYNCVAIDTDMSPWEE